MPTAIHRLGNDEPVRFAAAELKRYLEKMTRSSIPIRRALRYQPHRPGIWLGTADRFSGHVPRRVRPTGDPFADAVYVSGEDGHVVLTGPNPRSVLFAVYRYLEELGCRWFRPGPGGERVSTVKEAWRTRVRICETPSTRHRVMVIEGNASEQHVKNMVDYVAKRGFNAYFLQLRDSYFVFDGWYSVERGRRGHRAGRLPEGQAHRHFANVKRAIRRRGLVVHAMGHGWTNWPLGIRGHDWRPLRQKLAPSVRRYLAKVGGRRAVFNGIPLNTNLCMSQARVRTRMAKAVVDHARANPDEQVLHVWLADGANNTCECAGCRKARPSDFYVRLLNEIDRRLSDARLPTRIVFLAYVDLLWAPQTQRIRNPDRFILMFAPITRSYTTAYLDHTGRKEKIAPYRRNRLTFPTTPQGNLRMLADWRKRFRGECVCFDYHLWLDPLNDPGQMCLLPVLFKDVRGLDRLAMDGFLAVTTQRLCFPTGLYLHVLGRTLWNAKASYRGLVDGYLHDLFGGAGVEVRRYLERLSRLFDPPLLRGEKTDEMSRRQAVRHFARVPPTVKAFAATIRRGCRSSDPATAAAWAVLRDHAWYVSALAELYHAAYGGERARASRLYEHLGKELDRRLGRLEAVFDTRRARQHIWGTLRRANLELAPPPG